MNITKPLVVVGYDVRFIQFERNANDEASPVCQKPEQRNVLLVDPAMIPRSDKERLLTAADYCVTAVPDLREMFELRFERPIAFAVLNDLLGPFGLKAAAESVRRQWPLAKIFDSWMCCTCSGRSSVQRDDHHRHEEEGFVDMLRLLAKDMGSQRIAVGYGAYRRAAAIAESDPTKALSDARSPNWPEKNMPLPLPSMRAAG